MILNKLNIYVSPHKSLATTLEDLVILKQTFSDSIYYYFKAVYLTSIGPAKVVQCRIIIL